MTKRKHNKARVPAGRQRMITVRSVRKENPDVAKLAKASIALALEEARKKAEAEADDRHTAA